jgi:hypothetical protein
MSFPFTTRDLVGNRNAYDETISVDAKNYLDDKRYLHGQKKSNNRNSPEEDISC